MLYLLRVVEVPQWGILQIEPVAQATSALDNLIEPIAPDMMFRDTHSVEPFGFSSPSIVFLK